MSSVNRESFISSFPLCMPVISLAWGCMGWESRQQSLSPKCSVACRFLVTALYQVEQVPFRSWLAGFLSWLDTCKMHSLHRDLSVWFSCIVSVLAYIASPPNTAPALHSWSDPHLVVAYYSFHGLLDLVSYLVEHFASIFVNDIGL